MQNNQQATLIEKYTSSEYLNNNPTWHVEDSPWKARQIIKILTKNNLKPKSICEIGCGAGEILHQLYIQMEKTILFSGYEISPYAFELCQQRKEDRLEFKMENAFDDTSSFFDIVMAIDVFEHIEDYFGFLRNLKKKGEYKIFHIPLDMSVQTVFRMSPILRSRENVGHIHYFSKNTALATLKDTGYEIIDYFYTPGALDLASGRRTFKSLLLRLPRKIGYKINKDLVVRILGGYSLMVLTK
jgi:cyclopropane fatty-acyl-phospholipid synthase-like methyltransferase